MNQENAPIRSSGGNHNWPLIRRVVDLLRKSSVGLTPATLLELIEETDPDPADDVSRRGNYQRVLRALQQLEAMGMVQRAGRRYLLQGEALEADLQRQAKQAVDRLLEGPGFAHGAEALKEALLRELGKRAGESLVQS